MKGDGASRPLAIFGVWYVPQGGAGSVTELAHLFDLRRFVVPHPGFRGREQEAQLARSSNALRGLVGVQITERAIDVVAEHAGPRVARQHQRNGVTFERAEHEHLGGHL